MSDPVFSALQMIENNCRGIVITAGEEKEKECVRKGRGMKNEHALSFCRVRSELSKEERRRPQVNGESVLALQIKAASVEC